MNEEAKREERNYSDAVYRAYDEAMKGEVIVDEFNARRYFFRGWTRGYDAGYDLGKEHGYAAASRWRSIDGDDDLPKEKLTDWLVSVDAGDGRQWTEEARYNEAGHWESARTDGYNEPIYLDVEYTVTAYQPMPTPFTPDKETGE